MLVADALAAKWAGDAEYPSGCATFDELRAANWPAILLNMPELLAELCADALDCDIETEFCRALIPGARLSPPRAPARALALGAARARARRLPARRDGVPLDLGPKPPTRSLDIVRVLAVAKDHTCSSKQLYDWLWPDADGDQAKAACEQALHRLRRLLGRADLIVQREGQLRLDAERSGLTSIDWELGPAWRPVRTRRSATRSSKRAIARFPGPLLPNQRSAPWLDAGGGACAQRFIDR